MPIVELIRLESAIEERLANDCDSPRRLQGSIGAARKSSTSNRPNPDCVAGQRG